MEKDNLGIPVSAKIVKAFGMVSLESLSDEYKPTPERRAAFVAELRDMDEATRQSEVDDRDVRL